MIRKSSKVDPSEVPSAQRHRGRSEVELRRGLDFELQAVLASRWAPPRRSGSVRGWCRAEWYI
eukprot:9095286-Pyramimonas_sp.AAC.1